MKVKPAGKPDRGFHPSSFRLHPLILERETRFELATLALARRCSTTELLPLWSTTDSNDSMIVVKRATFWESPKSNVQCPMSEPQEMKDN